MIKIISKITLTTTAKVEGRDNSLEFHIYITIGKYFSATTNYMLRVIYHY